ncbi:MAG: hypothetical protein R3E66_02860 [bacterium]
MIPDWRDGPVISNLSAFDVTGGGCSTGVGGLMWLSLLGVFGMRRRR